MAYNMYFGTVLMPVTPGKIQTKIKNRNKTATLINEGEVNILNSPGLTEISFTLLLPNIEYEFASYAGGFKPAQYYLDEFERIKLSLQPFQFMVAGTFPDGSARFVTRRGETALRGSGVISGTNKTVTLEDYKINEDVKDGFDLSVDISLKHYRHYGTKILETTDGAVTAESDRLEANPPFESPYTVKAGDHLWLLASKFLGQGERYTEIYELNKAVIDAANEAGGSTKYTIHAGQELIIPA